MLWTKVNLPLTITEQRELCNLCSVWYPSKQSAFTQCCFNVGPALKTVAQHWNNIGWMSRVCWDIFFSLYTQGHKRDWRMCTAMRYPSIFWSPDLLVQLATNFIQYTSIVPFGVSALWPTFGSVIWFRCFDIYFACRADIKNYLVDYSHIAHRSLVVPFQVIVPWPRCWSSTLA